MGGAADSRPPSFQTRKVSQMPTQCTNRTHVIMTQPFPNCDHCAECPNTDVPEKQACGDFNAAHFNSFAFQQLSRICWLNLCTQCASHFEAQVGEGKGQFFITKEQFDQTPEAYTAKPYLPKESPKLHEMSWEELDDLMGDGDIEDLLDAINA